MNTDTITLTGRNTGWWGRFQDPEDLPKARLKVAAATAAALGVDVAEVTVVEVPHPAGVALVGSWCPPR